MISNLPIERTKSLFPALKSICIANSDTKCQSDDERPGIVECTITMPGAFILISDRIET